MNLPLAYFFEFEENKTKGYFFFRVIFHSFVQGFLHVLLLKARNLSNSTIWLAKHRFGGVTLQLILYAQSN